MALKDKLMTLEDFKAVRDVDVASNSAQFTEIKADLDAIEPGLSDDAKNALLNCFAHIAFTDDDVDYYGILRNALYTDVYPRITTIFDQGTHNVYHLDSLDTLKPYLTVKYYENSTSVGTVVADSNYTLSGNLVEGNQIIMVRYLGLVSSFVVNVSNPFLYRLANTPVVISSANPVDTGLKLLSENRSFTIAFSLTDNKYYPNPQDGANSNWAFGCYTTASPYQGIYCQIYDGGKQSGTEVESRKIRHVIRCVSPGTSGGQAIFDAIMPITQIKGRRVRFCFSYDSVSGTGKAFCSVNDAVLTSTVETFNVNYVALENNLIIGGRKMANGYEVMNCTFNDFKVFNSALSDAEMQAYVEGVA